MVCPLGKVTIWVVHDVPLKKGTMWVVHGVPPREAFSMGAGWAYFMYIVIQWGQHTTGVLNL